MPQDRRDRAYRGSESYPELELASAARTTTGSGTAFEVQSLDSIKARLNITAVSGGSPSMTAGLEVSFDGGTTWEDRVDWAAKTGTGTDNKVFSVTLATHARWAWTITGTTPSFTFAIDQLTAERSE